jgi:mannose-6-phosphate isomerase-like protein (cupin superfamily)
MEFLMVAQNYSNPADAYTEVAVYDVTAAQQQALYDLLVDATNSWQRLLPGFISANIYLSEDHTHIVDQVEWRTQADWQNSLQYPERAVTHSKIETLNGNIHADVKAYKAPQVIKGPMPENGFLIPMWKDEEATPVARQAYENKVVLLTGARTNNLISMVGFTNLPGDFNTLHVHTREDEIWHIIEGEFEFRVGEKIFRAGPGDTVFGPRNIQHCFRYAGESGVGRLIILYTPAGSERFFLQLDEWAANGVEFTPEMVMALSDSLGSYLV